MASILLLSSLGVALAVVFGTLARRYGRETGDRGAVVLIGIVGLLVAWLLPFAWVRLFGTG